MAVGMTPVEENTAKCIEGTTRSGPYLLYVTYDTSPHFTNSSGNLPALLVRCGHKNVSLQLFAQNIVLHVAPLALVNLQQDLARSRLPFFSVSFVQHSHIVVLCDTFISPALQQYFALRKVTVGPVYASHVC